MKISQPPKQLLNLNSKSRIQMKQNSYKLHPIFVVQERFSDAEIAPKRQIQSVQVQNSSSGEECELVWDQCSRGDIRIKSISMEKGTRKINDIRIQNTFSSAEADDDIFTLFNDI
ncbi:Hypothetical_protein [Hexamita inflata]|uniref:Hypothetical_protein n=1 Tax=Hexamita inflata TaxID=28002 RepID=A0AA86QGQ3_9EUKA|nr:Hypothetical protein HINF_LOCUS46676 [Hexamita inflata]CAI9959039.1 Hypothetical protein HINF_LOCUS46684 [Hexamita inflata]